MDDPTKLGFKERGTKACANQCAMHGWCGAFYLNVPKGGLCHLIDIAEISETYIQHGQGIDHF